MNIKQILKDKKDIWKSNKEFRKLTKPAKYELSNGKGDDKNE